MAGALPESPAGGLLSLPATPVAPPTVHTAKSSSHKFLFTAEIQQMMYGLGDCRKPLVESANLVETVVHQQMVNLLLRAEDVARMRNAKAIGIEDFLFLLRKDQVKLRRLVKYLELKDQKQQLQKQFDEEGEPSEVDGRPPLKRRRKICHDFLNIIDQTGELLSVLDDDFSMDEIKHRRALRAEMQTRGMDAQEYKEFAEARQASFGNRLKSSKLRDWVSQIVSLEIKPNVLAFEVLSYMAFETVAQIMDLALIVKRDCNAKAEDPFSKVTPHSGLNYESLSNGVVKGQMAPPQSTAVVQALKSPNSSAPASPLTSPPSTPTTPSTTGFVNLSSSGSATKSKGSSKKKKKAASATYRDLHTYNAVTPPEIREALRRFTADSGPFVDLTKAPSVSSKTFLLCV